MTVRDSMRRHPAGKALPQQKARLVRHVARGHVLEAIAGLAGVATCSLFVACGVLESDLEWWLRALLVAPLSLVPALWRQGVHGARDAVECYAWARYYDQQAREATLAASNPERRRTQ